MYLIGNRELLSLPKTTFLCSRRIPASAVLKCYDWAIAQRDAGNCIACGSHSQIEKDVFGYLLKGSQPLILVLARGMKKRIPEDEKAQINSGRLLIISPFQESVIRINRRTTLMRNKWMIANAEEVVIGFASAGGQIETLIKQNPKKHFLIL
jgi:hypothetical protein